MGKKIPTTIKEFNTKYAAHLELGYYGLAFGDDEIIKYLEEEFQELVKIPGFQCSQMKLKFNVLSVYLRTASLLEKTKVLGISQRIEDNVIKLLKAETKSINYDS